MKFEDQQMRQNSLQFENPLLASVTDFTMQWLASD